MTINERDMDRLSYAAGVFSNSFNDVKLIGTKAVPFVRAREHNRLSLNLKFRHRRWIKNRNVTANIRDGYLVGGEGRKPTRYTEITWEQGTNRVVSFVYA